MTTWHDVSALCARLPDARPGEAHEGSPAWYAGRHAFARLRWDEEGHELLQSWTRDMDTQAALATRREAFPVVRTFDFRVSTWGRLDLIDRREVAELLLNSYAARGGVRRAAAVDVAEFLAS